MIVLDCNAAFAIAMNREDGKALEALMLEGERIIAPQLLVAELASTARKYVRGNVLSYEQALEAIRDTMRYIDEFVPAEAYCEEVFSEAIRLNHSAYDMFYFVLARRTASTLFTFDKGLQALCHDNGVDCIGVERI